MTSNELRCKVVNCMFKKVTIVTLDKFKNNSKMTFFSRFCGRC